ncbi:VapC toxin protein [Fimbriimonas ginsengisoli Gsoil 348]|uniref:VapC toxin protein n=1 Tax=Fimbriimonas ginsengisoli Gsoil 348 TaxID=661478 RepID=A0A068NPY5_FIMGI|nr:VapC toxin protein [Fimbriimonas ginsengisoli Gsoil 348]
MRELEIVRKFSDPLTCHPFDERIADKAAELRAILVKQGNLIGPYDLQIAASALELRLTLVTHNLKEFARVPGLPLEDWES